MEVVVSPLTFGQGSKRRFGSSPIHSTSNPATGSTEDFDMDDDCTPGGDGYGFQSTKRRRRGSGEGLGTEASSCSFQVKENWSPSPFAMAPGRSPMAAVAAQSPIKRNRGGAFAHDDSPLLQKLHELQVMVEQQAMEIQRLKAEKESAASQQQQLSSLAKQQLLTSTTSSSSGVSNNHHVAKVEHENKILKRAVTIQQERQTHLNAELEGARQFKVDAEERIRRLEQMNLTLQYRLQAVTMSPVNDNMWSSPRPPDIY